MEYEVASKNDFLEKLLFNINIPLDCYGLPKVWENFCSLTSGLVQL